jgi:two-component system response regulator
LKDMPGRILLVEDDPHDVELVQLALEPIGVTDFLDVVSDGELALQHLLGQPHMPPQHPLPRVVLLDLKLPKLNGLQVLSTIRQHPRTRQLAVVVMTSSQEDTDLDACYHLGVNSYIVKPLDHELFWDVAQAIGRYWMTLNQPPPSILSKMYV